MLIKKADRKEFKNSEKCIVYEYPFNTEALNSTYIIINGRYPDKGCSLNEESEEIVYVVSGTGKVSIDNKEYILETGDEVYIPKQKKFFWDKCKDFHIIASCAPTWNPQQYKYIK